MKGRFCSFLSKIKSFLFHKQKTKQVLMACSFLFLAYALLVPAGALHSSTPIYDSAYYFSHLIAQNDSMNYIGVLAEQIDEKHPMNSTASEYRGLYGTFGNKKVNYAGTVNADKATDVCFTEFDDSPMLSYLYVSVGFQSKKYEDHYMHETYPIELMFDGHTSRIGDDFSFIYISQSHADSILKIRKNVSETNFAISDYEELIRTSTIVNINGHEYSYTIGNIYLETNYFYDALHECMGDFVIGYNTYPEGMQKQAMFFMNSYEYQNKTHLEYALGEYNPSHYKYKLSKGIINANLNNKKALTFTKDYNVATIFSYFILVISITAISVSLFFIYKYNLFEQNANYIYFALSSLAPYLLFYLIFKFSKSVYVFAPFGVQGMLFALMLFAISCFILTLIKKWRRSDA